jgi:hypothetical protein
MKEIINKVLTTGEGVLLLCRDEKHLSSLRTLLSRERVKMLRSPETRAHARLITTQVIHNADRLFLKICLKESRKLYTFSETGELQEVES